MTKKIKKNKIALVEFGLGGSSYYYLKNPGDTWESRSGDGYSNPDTFLRDHSDSADRIDFTGAVCIDKRAVVEKFPEFAIKCPLVDVNLPPGQVKKCPEIDPFFAGALGGEFKTLANLKIGGYTAGEKYGFLDTVPLDTYVIYWRERGARIGRIFDGAIIWEPLTREPGGSPIQFTLFPAGPGPEDKKSDRDCPEYGFDPGDLACQFCPRREDCRDRSEKIKAVNTWPEV